MQNLEGNLVIIKLVIMHKDGVQIHKFPQSKIVRDTTKNGG